MASRSPCRRGRRQERKRRGVICAVLPAMTHFLASRHQRGHMLKVHLTGLMVLACALMVAPSQAGEIPDAIKAAGVLHLSINTTYPPLDFTNPSTAAIVGLDVDLADAVAGKLGLKIEWTEVPFAQLIPSLKTKRTDFIWSGIGDLPSRQDTMDFVDYLKTGTQFYTLT